MIYHLFQNSVWKVVKIAKTSNLKSAVKSQSITTVSSIIFKLQRRTIILLTIYSKTLQMTTSKVTNLAK